MYCNKCGNSVPDNTTICPVCGNQISNQNTSGQNWNRMNQNTFAQNWNGMNQNSLGQNQKTSLREPVLTGNLWMVISILAILVIFLSGIVVLFIVKSYRNNKADNAVSSVSTVDSENDKTSKSDKRDTDSADSKKNDENLEESKETEKISDNENATDSSKDITEEVTTKEEIITEATTEAVVASDGNNSLSGNVSSYDSFYGIWCYGSKAEADALGYVETMKANGLEAECLLTTDWSNLNPEPYFVVTVGRYPTEEEAKIKLKEVAACEVSSDAYVKYSGDYIGEK